MRREILRRVEHEGEGRVGVLTGPFFHAGGVVDGRPRRLVDPPRPPRAAEHHATEHRTIRGVPLIAPVVGALVPEAACPLGVLVSPIEVLPRSPPPLASAFALHPEAAHLRETPVYVASVGLLRHVRVDRVQDRRARRLVTLSGPEEQFTEFFEIVVQTGHHPKVTAPGAIRNGPRWISGYASG